MKISSLLAVAALALSSQAGAQVKKDPSPVADMFVNALRLSALRSMPQAPESVREAAVDDTMVQFGSCGREGSLEMTVSVDQVTFNCPDGRGEPNSFALSAEAMRRADPRYEIRRIEVAPDLFVLSSGVGTYVGQADANAAFGLAAGRILARRAAQHAEAAGHSFNCEEEPVAVDSRTNVP